MADEDDDIEIEVDVQLDILIDMLTNNQQFIDKVRLALSRDARGKGNTLGRYAQAKRQAPPVIQPNAQQRVF